MPSLALSVASPRMLPPSVAYEQSSQTHQTAEASPTYLYKNNHATCRSTSTSSAPANQEATRGAFEQYLMLVMCQQQLMMQQLMLQQLVMYQQQLTLQMLFCIAAQHQQSEVPHTTSNEPAQRRSYDATPPQKHQQSARRENTAPKEQQKSTPFTEKQSPGNVVQMSTAKARQILGVHTNADSRTIKKQYYELSRKNHPDHLRAKEGAAWTPEREAQATQKQAEIVEAYNVLNQTTS